MPYLIDGHNLIPKIPGINLGDIDDEIQLITTLQDFCRRHGKNVEVYFDNAPTGQARTRKYGRVTAHFIRQGRTADSAIRARLKKLGLSARNWIVVTSDREIIAASREAHARVIDSDEFARLSLSSDNPDKISPESDPELSLSPDAVESWLQFFGSDEDQK